MAKISISTKEYNRRFAIVEGASARTLFTLVSGAFLAGFLRFLGAKDETVGIISALPVLAAMIQFVSPIIIEKLNWKRKLVLIGSGIHRFLLFSMIFLPFLPISSQGKVFMAGAIYFVSFLFVGFITPAIANMIVSFIPEGKRGSYFGMRESYILIASTIVSLVMGRVLDSYVVKGDNITGYIMVFGMVLINAIVNFYSIAKWKEVRIKPSPSKIKPQDVFKIPLKDKTFMKIIILFFLWNLGIQFGAPFFGLYMVSKLELSSTFISLNTMILSVSYLIFARIWGRVADERSWSFISMVTIGLLGFVHMFWFFIGKNDLMFVMVPFIHAVSGIALAGINIAMFNIQFDFTPNSGRSLYLGFNAAFSGIIGFLSALLASKIVGAFETWKISFVGVEIGIIQVVFFISGFILALTGLYIWKFIYKEIRKRRLEQMKN